MKTSNCKSKIDKRKFFLFFLTVFMSGIRKGEDEWRMRKFNLFKVKEKFPQLHYVWTIWHEMKNIEFLDLSFDGKVLLEIYFGFHYLMDGLWWFLKRVCNKKSRENLNFKFLKFTQNKLSENSTNSQPIHQKVLHNSSKSINWKNLTKFQPT